MNPSIVIPAALFARSPSLRKASACRPAGAAAATAALAALLLAASPAEAHYTSIVIDVQSGTVLEADNPDGHNYPASLTKMMTLYLTFEALNHKRLTLDQELPVSAHAAGQSPSKLGLAPGDTIKVEAAIMAVVTRSANDMAVVLAESQAGGEAAFAVRMTEKAHALGMTQTSFHNASGLPNDLQMSTPRDMATLAMALIADFPQYYHYFSRPSFTYNGQVLINHNHLMSRYPGMDGIKTGFINKSGFNLVASAMRNGHRLVGVVFGGPSARARDDYMASLLDSAFRRLSDGGAPAMARAAPAPAPETVADLAAAAAAADQGKVEETAARTGNDGAAGDRDDEPEAPAPKAQTLKPPTAKAPARTVAGAGRHGRWVIQLGSFKTAAAGHHAIDQAARHLPQGSGHPSPALRRIAQHHHRVFEALLVGFTDQQIAHQACSKIKTAGHACTVMSSR